MSNFIQQVSPDTICVTLSDKMTPADRLAIENAARALIKKADKIRALVILQNFSGFAENSGAAGLDFYVEHGDDIIKMALVGDAKWKADALIFTGAGVRKTEIRYFEMSQFAEAQRWITS